jgi:glycosyltransferase involved in cell wall biosynthesis/putative flippase GtrA
MVLALEPLLDSTALAQPPLLDVVVPVFNEEDDLAPSVARLHRYLTAELPFSFRITIADNASTDNTPAIGQALAISLPSVTYLRLDAKGRGRALRTAWAQSDAAVLAYTDVDLSTDLAALLPLVAPLLTGHSDLAIGTRLARGSRVVRGAKREVISRCYNLLLRGTMGARFSDAQCGFKAIRSDVAAVLLPLVEDNGWFFDTELLILAQRSGLRVHEVPVDWVDDPDSRVDIRSTAMSDLRGVARLARGFLSGRLSTEAVSDRFGRHELEGDEGLAFTRQALRFAGIGVASTVAYAALFLTLRLWYPAQGANVVALLVTAIANTAANRRLTFGVAGRRHALRHHLQGLALFAVAVALTSSSLAVLHHLVSAAPVWAEVAVLVTANAVVTLVRFLALRLWVFRSRRAAPERISMS